MLDFVMCKNDDDDDIWYWVFFVLTKLLSACNNGCTLLKNEDYIRAKELLKEKELVGKKG